MKGYKMNPLRHFALGLLARKKILVGMIHFINIYNDGIEIHYSDLAEPFRIQSTFYNKKQLSFIF